MANTKTMNTAAKLLGTTRQSILRWIESGLIKPKKVQTDATPAGFMYAFTETEIERMRKFVKKSGRPSTRNQKT